MRAKQELERSAEMPLPYDKVRIVGPDENDFFEQVLQDEAFNSDPNCILIGDGKRSVTLKEIREKLKGKIGKDTQIEIHVHACYRTDEYGNLKKM